jgi:sugar transferase (PEP-CTERM system associated)
MLRIFNVYVPTSVVALLASEAVLLFSCYVVAAASLLDVDLEIFWLYEGGMVATFVAVLTIILGMYFQDLYAQLRVRSQLILIQQVSLSCGVAFLTQAALNYINPGLLLPRMVMILGTGLVLVMVPVWRQFYSKAAVRSEAAQKVLVIGTNSAVRELTMHLSAHPEMGRRVIGYINQEPVEDFPALYLGTNDDLREAVTRTKPDRIVVGLAERRGRLPMTDLLDLRFSGIPIEDGGQLYEATFGRITINEIRPSDLIFTAGLGPNPVSERLQALYSPLIAVILLVLTAPIMLIVALLVKLTSKGPILYGQRRMGKGDKSFTVYKFRSMRHDAEKLTGAVWAAKDDPRITPIGKWLRKLRLDELPQLFNVLRGDMSMVGPRPERPEFTRTLSQQISFYRQRTCVRPGVTGWAQINHKYGDTIEDTVTKLEYDLYYIKHMSFSLDMYIIFSTIKIVLLGRGAQ